MVSNLKLISNRDDTSETKKEVHIHSRVNFDDRLSVHALGALLKFLEKKSGMIDRTELQYVDVIQISR